MRDMLDPGTLRTDYGDARAEAMACRSTVALFDFSFVQRVRLAGAGALATASAFCGRRLEDLAPGRIRYALRRTSDGAVDADLTVWRTGADTFDVMSGRREDSEALAASARGCKVRDLHPHSVMFSLQGPASLRALGGLTDQAAVAAIGYFGFSRLPVAGIDCVIGRLGYTGERGFELLAPRADGERLWQVLAGRARPAGFVAIDTLRIECGFVLFANECRLRPQPVELGLQALTREPSAAARMRLVCFRAALEPPARVHWPWRPRAVPRLPAHGQIAVTSACWSVHAGAVLGLGFVPLGEHAPGSRPLDPCVDFTDIELVPLSFIDPTRLRPRGGWTPDGVPVAATHAPGTEGAR